MSIELVDTPETLRRDLDRHEQLITYLKDNSATAQATAVLLEKTLSSFEGSVKTIRDILDKVVVSVERIATKQDEGIEKRLEMVEDKQEIISQEVKTMQEKINMPVNIRDHLRRWWWLYAGSAVILGIVLIRNIPENLWPHIVSGIFRIAETYNTETGSTPSINPQ